MPLRCARARAGHIITKSGAGVRWQEGRTNPTPAPPCDELRAEREGARLHQPSESRALVEATAYNEQIATEAGSAEGLTYFASMIMLPSMSLSERLGPKLSSRLLVSTRRPLPAPSVILPTRWV